jgi:hypothetical protein
MENIRVFISAHPKVVGLLFAFGAGYAGYNAYKAGMIVGTAFGGTAKATSESLGG